MPAGPLLIVAAAIVVVMLAAVVVVARRRNSGSQPLTEIERFARARELTTRWSDAPDTSPLHVREAPHDADALLAEE